MRCGHCWCGHGCGQQKDSAKQNCAPYYAAKTGFLVRKEMVRKEVRSESLYFLANRVSANSGANSKMMVIGVFFIA